MFLLAQQQETRISLFFRNKSENDKQKRENPIWLTRQTD
jgi:hypothetical protein